MKIEDYLTQHRILQIGSNLPGYVCSETIVDNPVELVSVVCSTGHYISYISWWDYSEIATGSTIGHGGPRDPANPNRYFYAETDICQAFNTDTPYEDYCDYIRRTTESYINCRLFPAFDIKCRKAGQGTELCPNDPNTREYRRSF